MKLINASLFLSISILIISSCQKNSQQATTSGNIQVGIKNAPSIYQQVNIDITQVSVHLVPDAGKADWIDLPTHAGVYNLLALKKGIDTTLVDLTKLSTGKITQIRLLLGNKNSVMKDSVVYPLTIPSGSQTGIKLIGQLTVPPAPAILKITLDFDAQQSINQTGNNEYKMQPTIKVIQ